MATNPKVTAIQVDPAKMSELIGIVLAKAHVPSRQYEVNSMAIVANQHLAEGQAVLVSGQTVVGVIGGDDEEQKAVIHDQ